MSRSIVFLSDFGYRNEWIGICHTVMNRIAPESAVVDLSHRLPPLDERAGATLLADSLRGNPGNAAEALEVNSGDLVWLLAPSR